MMSTVALPNWLQLQLEADICCCYLGYVISFVFVDVINFCSYDSFYMKSSLHDRINLIDRKPETSDSKVVMQTTNLWLYKPIYVDFSLFLMLNGLFIYKTSIGVVYNPQVTLAMFQVMCIFVYTDVGIGCSWNNEWTARSIVKDSRY